MRLSSMIFFLSNDLDISLQNKTELARSQRRSNKNHASVTDQLKTLQKAVTHDLNAYKINFHF